ncbi:unnamed protein product [Brachionus calyciflorus]|uniref:Uncharacterized protein n=1 Tax=Brachionus calyciflorus TaxID=104777 RepID=A0A813M5Y9_9BILA|nr:unnamed protein product [Brachionus calyciflorus]
MLEEHQKDQGHVLNLIQDVKTRSHSNFAKIKRIHKLHPFIETTEYKHELNAKNICGIETHLKPFLLEKDEPSKLGDLIFVLSPFNPISSNLSGETYVTSSMIIPGFKFIEK